MITLKCIINWADNHRSLKRTDIWRYTRMWMRTVAFQCIIEQIDTEEAHESNSIRVARSQKPRSHNFEWSTWFVLYNKFYLASNNTNSSQLWWSNKKKYTERERNDWKDTSITSTSIQSALKNSLLFHLMMDGMVQVIVFSVHSFSLYF